MAESYITDTSHDATARKVARLRALSYVEKAAVVDELNRAVQTMAEVGVRRRYPGASDREVFLRVAALRNGRELSVAVYGWDPDIEGW